MFKDRLNKLRVDAGLSQVELAKKIGVSAGAIGNYESGARPPKPEIAARLAEFFNVPVEDLVNGRALTRNEYKAFAQEVEDALDLITDEDLEVMQLDAAGIRRALRQRRPIREDRARTRLQEVGVPIDVARRLMGHSSVEITSKIYTHASEIALEAARKLIDGRGGCDPERDPAAGTR